MKNKIINIVVILVMAVIANYPMYNNLKSTAGEMNEIIQVVQAKVVSWQQEVNLIKNRIDVIQYEFTETINSGLLQTEDALNKIKALEAETKVLNNKIDSLKTKAIDKVKSIMDFKI